MTVRTAQTAKTSHRGSERPAWGPTQSPKRFPVGRQQGRPALNVAGIKLIRTKTFDQRRNFEFTEYRGFE